MAIAFPRLERLSVENYGMYPGTSPKPDLDVDLLDGLTLVLGANGLGKTTLITLIYRMLTGPYDIPNLNKRGELGGGRIDSSLMQPYERRILANRVVDGASGAHATLTFSIGKHQLVVSRRLDTLALTGLAIDGAKSDDRYQSAILRIAELGSFGDWILLLRHLTFYFEDRRALIWDASAQRHLLRLLFLPPSQATEWRNKEREILSLDSLVRNIQYSLNKEEKLYAKAEQAATGADEIRQQISLLQKVQDDEEQRLESLNDAFVDVVAQRQEARLNSLTAEQAMETIVRNIERLQLVSVDLAFPLASTTARYLLGHLLADGECLTCGSEVPLLAADLQSRIKEDRCPICNTEVATRPGRRLSRELERASKLAEQAQIQLDAASEQRKRAEDEYEAMLVQISQLNASTARRSAEIDELVRRLPPGDQDVHKQRAELASSRSRLEVHRETLRGMRADFEEFVGNVNSAIASQKDAIKAEFEKFAKGFLVEECDLVWALRRSRVGETGGTIQFASFELNMTGANFVSAVRRSGPAQVSESQREFIDLAFRMALMSVASKRGGTLVIDAPESSLDAVFVKRAADVLTRFANVHGNRLIVTSNLIDGDLIPHLIKKGGITSARDKRVVDLLRIAAPTAATKSLHTQYSNVRRALFAKAKAV